MQKPLVSIITPVFNAERHVESCIHSVIGQTFTDFEHLLIDDCSTDRSPVLIKQEADRDKRLRYYRMDKNGGAGLSRNKAIQMAKGQYIAFLDCDDVWHPEKLERQLAFMKDNQYHFSFTSYGTMDENGNLLGRNVIAKPRITYKKALYKNPIGCLTVIYDSHYFGKQYMPEIRKRQDYALWLKLLKKEDAFGLDENLATYRIQSQSVSSNKLSLIKYEWKIYRHEEGLSFIKSSYFLVSAILLKLKSYF